LEDGHDILYARFSERKEKEDVGERTSLGDGEPGEFHQLVDGESAGAHEVFV
jgi:hypothetical protein